MRLWQRLLQPAGEQRHSVTSIDDYFNYMSNAYPFGMPTSMSHVDREPPPSGFEGYVETFKSHPVVYGAIRFRTSVFSQARYQWQNVQTGNMFGNQELNILEQPWPGGSTSNLNSRMLLHGDLGGNAYIIRPERNRLSFMRPDWCTIILGSNILTDTPALAEDAEFVGVMYSPPAGSGGGEPRIYLADQVAHFAPMPDPSFHFRGMSWLTPVIRELMPDRLATEYKMKFFQQGATPNFALKADPAVTVEQLRAFKEMIEQESGGLRNAFKTLYLGGGMDPVPLGNTFTDMDFSGLQGKAETRILMAAGVHPVLAGASEGMQGASLNAGNFKQVRRNFSDIDLQALFLEAASSLQTILRVPTTLTNGVQVGSRLTVDPRNIPFLQDDQIDQAEIQAKQASAIATLIRDGYEPDAAVDAITTNDMRKLVGRHSGNLSVQLQPAEPQQGQGQ